MKPTTRAVYSNDRTAPRMGQAEFSTHVVTKDLWARFIVDFPEYSELSWVEFQSIWDDIAEVIRQEQVSNPLGFKLGAYAGELKYQYLHYKMKPKDINTSNEVGERVNHLNIITRGKVGKVKWERRWAVKRNRMLQFYGFEEDRRVHALAYQHTLDNPNSIRMTRNTTGGFSIWRQLRKK